MDVRGQVRVPAGVRVEAGERGWERQMECVVCVSVYGCTQYSFALLACLLWCPFSHLGAVSFFPLQQPGRGRGAGVCPCAA